MNISMVVLGGFGLLWALWTASTFFCLFVWLLNEVEVHWQHVTNKTKQSEFDTLLMAVENTAHQAPLQDFPNT